MAFPSLRHKAILSPMSGVTDVAFRTLAKKYCAGLTFTEFVSSAAVVRGNKETLRMLKTDPSEKPVGVQLFGNNAEEVVGAAKLLQKSFDVIDMNCGCPAYKVIKTGAGSDMLKNPKLIYELVSEVVGAVKKPVSVKIRIGIDDSHINAVRVAGLVEEAGASAITVHGRTQKQGYSGAADWNIIKKVKEAVRIPVIGNGDVFSPQLFREKLDSSGVDYIMLGRAAMTNPYIFKQIDDYLKTGVYQKADKVALFREYLSLAEKYSIPFLTIKNHAVQFTKGIKGSADFRIRINRCKDLECVRKLFGFLP